MGGGEGGGQNDMFATPIFSLGVTAPPPPPPSPQDRRLWYLTLKWYSLWLCLQPQFTVDTL